MTDLTAESERLRPEMRATGMPDEVIVDWLAAIEAAAADRERARMNDPHTRFCPTCTCDSGDKFGVDLHCYPTVKP